VKWSSFTAMTMANRFRNMSICSINKILVHLSISRYRAHSLCSTFWIWWW